ncbi:hypothetical protein JTE90_018653 [Oedothorax gibbosus]|uniref:GH18 domain-containing protein n=1 Tax=Oedothorax gibbosus TaxID=931172 RepID=A0AAV6UF21_9ARAC|nr:hypothetical protein JTE90_018653 [Oedothorax gibbosus]
MSHKIVYNGNIIELSYSEIEMCLKVILFLILTTQLKPLSSSDVSSSCSNKDRTFILLDTAMSFLSKAKEIVPRCFYDAHQSKKIGTSSSYLDTTKNLISAAKNVLTSRSRDSKFKVVCYFSSLAFYRTGDAKFNFSAFPPRLCTHAIYVFAKMVNNRIESCRPDLDLPGDIDGYKKFNDLKRKNSKLRTLISVGGCPTGSSSFSPMAADPLARSVFAESVLVFIQQHGFDGLDLNWIYSGEDKGKEEYKRNFVILLQTLKEVLKPKGYLLTSSVSPTKYIIDTTYDIPAISKELDFINLLSFHFRKSWQPMTGLNSPLYANEELSEEAKELTVDFVVDYWLKGGAPKQKLVMGMSLMGRTFTLANSTENGVLAPAIGPGNRGRLKADGLLAFFDICENLTKDGWASVWEPDSQTPYAYKGDQWVSYDDQRSLHAKICLEEGQIFAR